MIIGNGMPVRPELHLVMAYLVSKFVAKGHYNELREEYKAKYIGGPDCSDEMGEDEEDGPETFGTGDEVFMQLTELDLFAAFVVAGFGSVLGIGLHLCCGKGKCSDGLTAHAPTTNELLINVLSIVKHESARDEALLHKVVRMVEAQNSSIHSLKSTIQKHHGVHGLMDGVSEAEPDDTLPPSFDGLVTVGIEKCCGILASDANGTSDPFIKLYIGHFSQQTRVEGNTLDPVFNQSFEFHSHSSPDAVAAHTAMGNLANAVSMSGKHKSAENREEAARHYTGSPSELRIVCFDHDKGAKNDYLGECRIDLLEVFREHWDDALYGMQIMVPPITLTDPYREIYKKGSKLFKQVNDRHRSPVTRAAPLGTVHLTLRFNGKLSGNPNYREIALERKRHKARLQQQKQMEDRFKDYGDTDGEGKLSIDHACMLAAEMGFALRTEEEFSEAMEIMKVDVDRQDSVGTEAFSKWFFDKYEAQEQGAATQQQRPTAAAAAAVRRRARAADPPAAAAAAGTLSTERP